MPEKHFLQNLHCSWSAHNAHTSTSTELQSWLIVFLIVPGTHCLHIVVIWVVGGNMLWRILPQAITSQHAILSFTFSTHHFTFLTCHFILSQHAILYFLNMHRLSSDDPDDARGLSHYHAWRNHLKDEVREYTVQTKHNILLGREPHLVCFGAK